MAVVVRGTVFALICEALIRESGVARKFLSAGALARGVESRVGIYALAFLLAPGTGAASCGASFCDVNTAWSAHGAWLGAGSRADMRYEFVDQDELRTGSRAVAIGAVRAHHDEVQTVNRNSVFSLERALDPQAALSVAIPVISRSHLHIHNHRGGRLAESWSFMGLGDVRLLYQRRLQAAPFEPASYTLSAGIKLPTGSYDINNADGVPAERSLQPGTGTTDAILGVAASGEFLSQQLSWFAQALLQSPINSRADYRPGAQLQLDGGLSYAASQNLRYLAQVNMRYKSRDRGLNAEPEDSGGSFISLSPGLSYSVNERTAIYGFLQVPIYQKVNGVQLTSRWSATAGITFRF